MWLIKNNGKDIDVFHDGKKISHIQSLTISADASEKVPILTLKIFMVNPDEFQMEISDDNVEVIN